MTWQEQSASGSVEVLDPSRSLSCKVTNVSSSGRAIVFGAPFGIVSGSFIQVRRTLRFHIEKLESGSGPVQDRTPYSTKGSLCDVAVRRRGRES